jgi:hypothetical protein
MTFTDPRPAPAGDSRADLSPLAAEIHRILIAEAGHPPLSAASLAKVLRAIGFAPELVPVEEIQGAIDTLVREGLAEGVWRGGTRCYRALDSRQVGEPGGGT